MKDTEILKYYAKDEMTAKDANALLDRQPSNYWQQKCTDFSNQEKKVEEENPEPKTKAASFGGRS